VLVLVAASLPAAFAGGASASFSTSAEPVPPKLSDVSQSASAWREANALAVITSAPIGTTFSFKLTERAHVTLTFVPRFSGRRKCTLRETPTGITRTCTRVFAIGTLSFDGHAGANHVRFSGRLSNVAKLAPARYRLTISARNAVGAATPVTLHFTILR
jgi:hypothetical protein